LKLKPIDNENKVNTLDARKNLNKFEIAPILFGIIIGIFLSIVFDFLYIFIFHESSSKFYLFAGLALLGGPLIGGIISALTAKGNKFIALLISSITVFILLLILSVLSYVVLPVFSYDGVQVPASCINASNPGSHLPSYLNYSIPGIGTGTLITSDKKSAVVAITDYDHLPFYSTVYLINKSSNKVIQSLQFNNDIIGAAIDDGVLYIFNDKIGYFIDVDNGESVKNLFTIDNYRGIYKSNNYTYMQTTFEISALHIDGSVLSHRTMNMSCIAYGCLISSSPDAVI
jgi:hypothetical protein